MTKQFTMQYHRTLKQMAVASLQRLPLQEKFLAVNDVSFTVEQGESVGLMGLNGSGQEHAAQGDQRRHATRLRAGSAPAAGSPA